MTGPTRFSIIVLCDGCGGVYELSKAEKAIAEAIKEGDKQIEWVRGLNPKVKIFPREKWQSSTDSQGRMRRILDAQRGITKAIDI